MPSPELRIGTRPIGPGHPVYFIAEAGSNHDRNLDQARRLIDVAADAGADAVKFQTFRADSLYARSAGQSSYLKVDRSINDIIRDLEMPFEWIPLLAAHCAQRGVHFLSTPFDHLAVDALDPYVPAFKVASYEMTHYPLLQQVVRKGKPVIVSTGTAEMAEVEEMIAAVAAVGNPGLVVLQCTAKYPAPLSALNVKVLTRFAAAGVLTGLSDHSREVLPGPLAAVALGASVIEKHFTLSNALPGPDHAYAIEPAELTDLIQKVRQVEAALGSGQKTVQPEEQELRSFARRTIFTTRPIAAGEMLRRADLIVLRCGTLPYGLHPRQYLHMLGRRTTRPLASEATPLLTDVTELQLGSGDLILRPIAPEDSARIVAWRSRAEVAAQMFAAAPPTLAEHQRWFESLQRRTDRIELAIVDAAQGAVGTIGLSQIDWGANSAEYGILLGEPSARGRGIARRASQLVLEYGFGILGLEKVSLRTFADNVPALGLYQRLGFKPGAALEGVAKEGVVRPVLEMVLSRAEWTHTFNRESNR